MINPQTLRPTFPRNIYISQSPIYLSPESLTMTSLTIPTQLSYNTHFHLIHDHDQFYLPGGDFYIIIKDIRFRVHKYFFERESTHFRTIFKNSPIVGSTSQLALNLSDTIEPDVFELLLGIIYNRQYNLYNLTIGQWFDVQTYAHIWQFPEMYSLTVREIEHIRIKEETNPDAIEAFKSYEIRQHRQYERLLENMYAEDKSE